MSEIKNVLASQDVAASRGTRKLVKSGTGALEPDKGGKPDAAGVADASGGSSSNGAGAEPAAAAVAAAVLADPQSPSSLSLEDPASQTPKPGTWAGGSAFAAQLAEEAKGPAVDSGMSDFRRQMLADEARLAKKDNGSAEPLSEFKRQMQRENESSPGTNRDGAPEISGFRRQMLEEEKRLAERNKPPVNKPVPPAPVPPVPPAPVPPIDKPVPPVPPTPVPPVPPTPVPPIDKPVPPVNKPVPPIDKPLPPTDKPVVVPGDKLGAVRAALVGDALALANLDALAATGALARPDMQGSTTLLDHLATIATQPTPATVEQRRRLLSDTLADVARPEAISPPTAPPGAKVIGTAQARLARENPGEYARLVAGLSSDDGKTNLNLSGTVSRPLDWKPKDGAGSVATQLLGDSFAAKTDASKADNHFGKRFEAVLAAVQGDPAAEAGLGNLLLEGSLGNPDVRGLTVLERLANLANPAKAVSSKWNGALDDRNAVVKNLVKAIAPSDKGPQDLSEPRRLWARTSPGEFIRVASEIATTSFSAVLPETHFGVTWHIEQIEPMRAARKPPIGAPEYLASFEWMSPVMPKETASAVDRLKTVLADDPEALTAVNLIALRGAFFWSGGELKSAVRPEQVEQLAQVAEGKIPLAPGIDPREFVSSMLKDLATPSRAIAQGNSQTCTVTSLQRIMAEESPKEYVRIMLDLASPKGQTRLALGEGVAIARPADWNSTTPNDNRDVTDRLFQTTFMHKAVEEINQEAYKGSGFPASGKQADTYDAATDTWVDALGRQRRGLPPEALNQLLADVENQGKVHMEIPQAARDLLGQPDFPASRLLETIFKFMDARQKENKVWRVPVTLELTYPGGEKQLHEVLLSSVASGPPPTATILDPLDGHSKQLDLVAFGKSLRSISLPDDAADQFQKFMPHMPAVTGVAMLVLGQLGKYAQPAITTFLPLITTWMTGKGGTENANKAPLLPSTPPLGSPDSITMDALAASLPPGDTPARFALDTLVRSGQLDQRNVAGRALLTNLQDLARTSQDKLAAGVDKAQLLSSVIREVANADPLVAPVAGDTTAAASAQRYLAATRPAEFVRLIADLAGRDGTAKLNGGTGREIAVPKDWREATAGSKAELADRLLQPALDQFTRARIAEAAGAPVGSIATGPLGSWAIADMVEGMTGQNNPRVRLPETATLDDRQGFALRIGQQADLGKPVSVTIATTDAQGRKHLDERVFMGYENDPAGKQTVTLLDPNDGTPKRMALGDFVKSVEAARIPPVDADPAADVSFGLGSYLDDDAGWGRSRYNSGDAGWTEGRFYPVDAGWGRGRFMGSDAGWGRSRYLRGDVGSETGGATGEDAGWGRGRFVSGDAGWGRSRYVRGDAGNETGGSVGEDAGWGRSRYVRGDAGTDFGGAVGEDAGWGRSRYVRGDAGSEVAGPVTEDAGWGKGRFIGQDAGWGRSRLIGQDAGWGRSRYVRGDAGGSVPDVLQQVG